MEVCSQPGMASNSPGDLQNKVTKTQTAALGFRVKSGWAAMVLLTRHRGMPRSCRMSIESSCPIRDFLKRDSRITRRWENSKRTPQK